MSTRRAHLWFVRETQNARLYTRIPPERKPTRKDEVWIPRSQIEHTSKNIDGSHDIKIPEWLADTKNI